MRRQLALLAATLLASSGVSAALDNKAAEEMMRKDGCAACHAIDKKVVGPPFQEVAAKYQGDAKAAAMLIEKVKKGGSGVWGETPMPPNSYVSDGDIEALVTWVLTLKK